MIILFVWALRSELEHVLNGFDFFPIMRLISNDEVGGAMTQRY